MRKTLTALALTLLAACGHDAQYTSGTQYLAAYPPPARATAPDPSATSLDAAVRQAAAVEPALRIPGRFGLARIANGDLTTVPEAEAEAWRGLMARHGHLGEFVPVSPLVAVTTARAVGADIPARCGWRPDCDPVSLIRIGAARQHVDAVLVYEVGVRAAKTNTPFAVADLTIIGGAFLPTRHIAVAGLAQALLIDVRTGYPYGTASAVADLSELSPSFGSTRAQDRLAMQAMEMTVVRLVPEVEAMFALLLARRAAADRP